MLGTAEVKQRFSFYQPKGGAMLNYDEVVTRSAAHRDLLLTNAAQQRLAQSLAPSQPHPVTT
jgi:hypothetical protein